MRFKPFAFFQSTLLDPYSQYFTIVVKSDNSGSSTSTQFTLTGAEISSGTTFDVNFSPIANPTNVTSVTKLKEIYPSYDDDNADYFTSSKVTSSIS